MARDIPVDLAGYFADLIYRLETETGGSFAPDLPWAVAVFGEHSGQLRGVLSLRHNLRLSVRLDCDLSRDFPEWSKYVFQLLEGNDKRVWRIDNSPYHFKPGESPDHVHYGQRIERATRPSIRDVIERVNKALLAKD